MRALAAIRRPELGALFLGALALWFGWSYGLTDVALASGAVFAASAVLFANHFARYWRRVVVGDDGERMVKRTLEKLHVPALHDLYLPSERGSVQIDHVAAFPTSLVVVETKTYSGRFFIDGQKWFRAGRYRRRFFATNPIWQMEDARRHVAALFPRLKVEGYVVLAGSATVANNRFPDCVYTLDAFGAHIEASRLFNGERPCTEEVMRAWEELKQHQKRHAALSKHHVRNARKRRGEAFYAIPEYVPVVFWGVVTEAAAVTFLLRWMGFVL